MQVVEAGSVDLVRAESRDTIKLRTKTRKRHVGDIKGLMLGAFESLFTL